MTRYVGPIPKDMVLVKVVPKEPKINIQQQKLPLVCIIIKAYFLRNKHTKPKVSCISIYVLCVGLRMVSPIPTPKQSVVEAQKRINLDMPLGSRRVQESRMVVNSQYSNRDLLLLQGWSKQKIKQRFESAMACTKYTDYRTYAQALCSNNIEIHEKASKISHILIQRLNFMHPNS